MALDLTPLEHAGMAAAAQIGLGLLTGDYVTGAVAACAWFIAREHTQAEYRWIEAYGAGRRANMPWWGGFDVRVWNLPSVLDLAAPVVACLSVFGLVRHLSLS